MNILITGGAGFIGSNAANYFLNKGDVVTIFDNFSRKGSKKNIVWLQSIHKNLRIIVGDVRRDTDIKLLLNSLKKTNVVIHLAAQVAVTSSVKDPVEDFEVNARGTLNILEAMRTVYSSAKLIYASTNKVYGSLSNIDVTEETNRYVLNGKKFGISEDQPLDFHSPYGCSKGAADQYIHDYSRIYGLDTVVFRQSCIYGPRQFGVEDQGWVAWFMIALVLGKQITIYGNGKQVRDLLFIDDLIEAYSMAVSQKLVTKGKVYNIGGGMENTISVWAEFKPVLEELFSKTIEANFEPERPGDQPTYVSDIRKAQREFGWVPKTGLREGIKILHNWITANKKLFL